MQDFVITPAQCKAARQSLGVSLKQLSDESQVNRSYLSMFENGKLPLAEKYQQALVDFFTKRGVALDELIEPAPVVPPRATQVMQGAFRRCMFMSPDIPQDQYDRIIAHIEANDERLAELLNAAVTSGSFSTLDKDSEAVQRDIFGLLAGNHVLFRLLQGHNIVTPRGEGLDAKTHSDLLADWFAMGHKDVFGTAPAPAQADPERVEQS